MPFLAFPQAIFAQIYRDLRGWRAEEIWSSRMRLLVRGMRIV